MIRPLKFILLLALIYCVKVNAQKTKDALETKTETATNQDSDEFILEINEDGNEEEDLDAFQSDSAKKTANVHKLSSKKEISDSEVDEEEFFPSQEVLDRISKVFEQAAREYSRSESNASSITLLSKQGISQSEMPYHSTGRRSNKESHNMHKLASIALKAGSVLMEQADKLVKLNGYHKKKKAQKNYNLIKSIQIPEPYCPRVDKYCCDASSKFRTITGACNNLEYPWWGSANSPFARLLEAAFPDKLGKPRTFGINGKPLPGAKVLSNNIHTDKMITALNNQFFTFFGQFLDHDIANTALSSQNGKDKKCYCGSLDPDCFNIDVPKGDLFADKCIPFTRSAASLPIFDCHLGQRTDFNLLTHWLDLNPVYGNTVEESKNLRKLRYGLLKSSAIRAQEYLPFKGNGQCTEKTAAPCFFSGDERAEQNSWLTAMQVIFLRTHNRFARILYKYNQNWDDDRIFEEARRINIAVYQNIVYNEYVPLLIGHKLMKEYDLYTLENGYSYGYDSQMYPQILTEFSTAAFRLHHTMYHNFTEAECKNYIEKPPDDINEYILDTSKFFVEAELIMCGMFISPGKFSTPGLPFSMNLDLFHIKGFSMAALSIQRGRDHGLQPYVKYRELCGFGKATKFSDLKEIPKYIRDKLEYYYDDVGDIDPWVGMTAEVPHDDALVGPTAACIIAKQFRISKFSDRFYFENGKSPVTRFTRRQLKQIRKSSLARILCDVEKINFIQEYPFLMPNDKFNNFYDCKDIPKFSLEPWYKSFYNDYYVDKVFSNIEYSNKNQ